MSNVPCGFGFSSMSGAYKVVRFRCREDGIVNRKRSGFLHWIDWSRVVIFAFKVRIFKVFPYPWLGFGRKD
ncbi:hypothetical protein Pyn_10574 [Prunus yedoensis var. nudiflora]|uniref:Uncharacterized protein n=1 Tax=Prunus yedoensis var. nudiflora TaxID=2094558 RepID=A0A314XMF1_PRUYE|nr:hypothetical protein Pyn_10574 [Prunus yedoensis var. nudiflora]